MTRIEGSMLQERQSVRKDIRDELRGEDRRKGAHRALGCLFLALLLVGVPVGIVAGATAKSGWYRVPALTAMLFRPDAPARVVIPLEGTKPEDVMSYAATRATFDPATSYLTVRVREDELTTIVRDAIAHAPEHALPFPMRGAQVAIDEDEAEMFAQVPRGGIETSVRVRFTPVVVAGELQVRANVVRVGALEMPEWLSHTLASTVGRAFFTSLQANMSKAGELHRVTLKKGVLELTFKKR